MSRHPEQDMTRSWGGFDTTIKLCKNAHSKGNVARYRGLLETLESSFYKFDELWRIYKEDIIKKQCKTEEAFNATELGDDGISTAVFKYNDTWSEQQFERYVETRDLLQDVVDQAVTTTAAGENTSTYDPDFAVENVKMLIILI